MSVRIFLLFCLFLCSCSSNKKIGPLIPEQPLLGLEMPEPLVLQKVEFILIHENNIKEVFAKLKKQGQQPILFGLSGSDYKSLAVNIDQIQGYVKTQRKIIILYQQHYEGRKGK